MTEPTVEPLVTQCPDCATRFRVTPVQLDAAKGQVRCGICNRVFLAADSLCIGEEAGQGEPAEDANLDELLDELENSQDMETDPGSEFLESFESESEPIEEAAAYTSDIDEALRNRLHNAALGAQSLTMESETALSEDPVQSEPESEDYEPPEHPHIQSQLPDLLPSPERTVGQVVRPFVIGIALVLVGVQVFWFKFDEWAVDPGLRPLYGNFCEVADCTLPDIRSLAELHAKNVVIRPHADNPDLLVVDAIIVNNADFAQRFPLIDMRFTSVNGILVLGLKIRPEQYLSGDAAGMSNIESRSPVHVSFEIGNPGPEGPNFDLKLL